MQLKDTQIDEYSTHNPEAVAHLMEMIADIKYTMMTTLDKDGALRSRPMQTLDSQSDGTLYFFSNDHNGKAEELALDPRVNLAYSLAEKNRYISISGLAEIVHDDAKKQELWKPEFRAWYPDGVDDPHLGLLKVYVQKAEYWDVPSKTLVEIVSFTKAILTGNPYHPFEGHQKLSFEGQAQS